MGCYRIICQKKRCLLFDSLVVWFSWRSVTTENARQTCTVTVSIWNSLDGSVPAAIPRLPPRPADAIDNRPRPPAPRPRRPRPHPPPHRCHSDPHNHHHPSRLSSQCFFFSLSSLTIQGTILPCVRRTALTLSKSASGQGAVLQGRVFCRSG